MSRPPEEGDEPSPGAGASPPGAPFVPLAPGVDAVPILHGRLEFAALVRRALIEDPPDAVAVELPPTLEALHRRAVAELPALCVVETPHEDGRPALLFVTPQDGLAEAVRSADELGLPVHYVDQDVEGYPSHLDLYPDPAALRTVGLAAYVDACRQASGRGPLDQQREATMAHHLHGLRERYGRTLFVGGLFHLAGLRAALAGPRPPLPLAKVRARTGKVFQLGRRTVETTLCLGEPPYLIAAYELARQPPPSAGEGAHLPPDRARLGEALLGAAAEAYRAETGDEVRPPQLRVLGQFARNLARLDDQLVPDFLQLVVAARGAIDEEYGHEVLRLGTTYPHMSVRLPSREVTDEELDWMHRRAVKLHPRQRRVRPRPDRLNFRRRPREARPGEWAEDFDPERSGMCSYPPEDIVIEEYGSRLKRNAKTLLAERHSKSEPFTASLRDGVDVRETIRRFYEGKVFVRDAAPLAGEVGSVVVIFDEDRDRYPWEVTWWGEHDQESDMAFFATRPEDRVVGPGVARCEYGGYLLSYPPRRLYDVWDDPWYQGAASAAERLLMAGVEYSLERLVAYVAARPPRSRLKAQAERFGRQIVYIPLGSLSPEHVRRIRSFHVLDDHKAREWAKDYILREDP